jgi:hypothetical protein
MNGSAQAIVDVASWTIPILQVGLGGWFLHRFVRLKLLANRVKGQTLKPLSYGPSLDDSSTSYVTRFEYVIDGVLYEGKGRSISNIQWFHREGQPVWVYYRRGRPQDARLVNWVEPAAYLLVVGVGLTLIFRLLLSLWLPG